jgi:hypothetical protein
MAEHLVFHPQLTKADALILEGLRQDINEYKPSQDAQAPKGAYSSSLSQ